jgi:GH15 family glucan-1,4-alpha-glucosidase
VRAADAAASIGDHGLIGDTRTAALVTSRGTIDWLCLPRFDSEPVFGSLLDPANAGRFTIDVHDAQTFEQRYRERTATLETGFGSPDGGALLSDGFVLDVSSDLLPQAALVRSIRCERGDVVVRVLFDPRRGFSGAPLRAARRQGGLVATDGSRALILRTAPDLSIEPGRPIDVVLHAGDELIAVLCASDAGPIVSLSPEHALRLRDESDGWWRRWCDDIRYDGPLRGAVERSLITMRLLTYAPSGAPVAAPTTSIPAPPGSERAWDYRYSWPRDASLGIGAFLALRGYDEPHAFLRWLTIATTNTRPRIRPIYTLDGRQVPEERIHDAPSGYDGRTIVRTGNAAATQHQLDAYGWVVEAAWRMVDAGERLDRETRRAVKRFADFVAEHWQQPDSGIWEVRDNPEHYVHSKLSAWAALDRAASIGGALGASSARVGRWNQQRDTLSATIRSRGFEDTRNTYLRAFGRDDLDAATLLVASMGFDAPDSPPVHGTIDAVRAELGATGALLYRYTPGTDGLAGTESAFVPCSFWLAQALALSDRLDEAAEVFDELCGLSTPLGLYAEQINPTTGEHEGNFPQALSHAALLHAAAAIEASSDAGTRRAVPRTRRGQRS